MRAPWRVRPESLLGVNIPTGQRGLFIHMMPRTDGIVLGGTSERDVWTTDVNEAEKTRIIDNHVTLFASMRAPGAPLPATTSARR